jgi:hypothetical protein
MERTRDVRLSGPEIAVLLDAARRRRRELKRSIDRDSGTYHRALERKWESWGTLCTTITVLETAAAALDRQQVAAVRERLEMES